MDITETLTSVEEQVIETTKTVQDQVVEYVRKAVSAIDEALPSDRPSLPFADSVPAPAEIVERGFGIADSLLANQSAFAKQLLDTQHQFAKGIVDALSPFAPKAVKPVAKPKAAAKAA